MRWWCKDWVFAVQGLGVFRGVGLMAEASRVRFPTENGARS